MAVFLLTNIKTSVYPKVIWSWTVTMLYKVYLNNIGRILSLLLSIMSPLSFDTMLVTRQPMSSCFYFNPYYNKRPTQSELVMVIHCIISDFIYPTIQFRLPQSPTPPKNPQPKPWQLCPTLFYSLWPNIMLFWWGW